MRRVFPATGPLQTMAGPWWHVKVTVCLPAAEFILPSAGELPNFFTRGLHCHLGQFYLKLHKEFRTRLFLSGSWTIFSKSLWLPYSSVPPNAAYTNRQRQSLGTLMTCLLRSVTCWRLRLSGGFFVCLECFKILYLSLCLVSLGSDRGFSCRCTSWNVEYSA